MPAKEEQGREASGRGKLRLYLGAAPGVGKTFAMLNEGKRRKDRGTDVVVGLVETHGRPHTAVQLAGLEVVPRKKMAHRGAVFEEMDLDAVLARKPQVALVDELAHSNVPGSRHTKRWQDVEELRSAGIEVISTLNIQHLESLNDVVQRITGISQVETIPDAVARSAEQIELVDMAPEALRRRMAHGNVYAADKVGTALANYFRVGNLSALRELALLWVADRVDESLQSYMETHGIAGTWETRDRVVVALTGAPTGDDLIRRGARMAARTKGDLLGAHVRAGDGLVQAVPPHLAEQRRLLEQLGGTYHEIAGTSVGEALVSFARAHRATRLVLGASQRSRLAEMVHGSVINRVIREAGPIDVHVISTPPAPVKAQDKRARGEKGGPGGSRRWARTRRRRHDPVLPARRRAAGWAGALLLPALWTLLLAQVKAVVGLPDDLLAYLLPVLAVAAAGGFAPGLASALISFGLATYYLVPSVSPSGLSSASDGIALVVFVAVAGTVSRLMSASARRAAAANRSSAQAESLEQMSVALLSHADPLPALAQQLRSSFSLDAVSILTPRLGPGQTGPEGYDVAASAGEPVPLKPEDGCSSVDLPGGAVVVLAGPSLATDDQRLVQAISAQVGVALEARRLKAQASEATSLVQANDLRTALLNAVSHDLRTPLASIKAAATALIEAGGGLPSETARDLLETIDKEADRLSALVGNLLDMSRLQAGALRVKPRPVGIDEVVGQALASLPERAAPVVVEVDENLPRVDVDPALLERALANVIDNAMAWSPEGAAVRVEAGAISASETSMPGGQVDVRVVDTGPGIPPADRERVFEPFQRLSDTTGGSAGGGVGLGLAVARGFVRAMGGELAIEDTPGGGCTMVVTLPEAHLPEAPEVPAAPSVTEPPRRQPPEPAETPEPATARAPA
ncbi:MAG: ATP-binding protein [Acidimicrobiales bacterium]